MAGQSWWEQSGGLRTVFGSIVQAASQGASTAQIWDAIRTSAANVATGILRTQLGEEPTPGQVASSAATLLKGVGATQVSQARGAAGQLVNAHSNLRNLEQDAQITANEVGLPPWAQTVNARGVQTQYRIRVLRNLTFKGFKEINLQEWGTYLLSGPLTTVADALAQANALFTGSAYNKSTTINDTLDYFIEAV